MRLRTVLTDTQFGSVASQGAYVASVAVMNVVVVRQWGAPGRGDLAIFVVLSTIGATIGGRGFSEVAVWAYARGRSGQLSGLFRRSLLSVSLAGGGAVAVAACLLPWRNAALVLAGTVLLHIFRAATGVHLAKGEVARFNVERTALPLATTLGIIGAALLGAPTPLLGYVVGELLAVGLVLRIVVKERLLVRGGAPSLDARTVGRQSVIGNVLGSSLSRIDVLAVGFLATPAATGVYSVALSVAELSLTAAYALSFHALREGAWGDGVASHTLRRGVWSTVGLSVAGLIGLALFAEPVLGTEFADIYFTFGLLVPGIVAIAVVKVRFSSDLTAGRGAVATRALATAVAAMLLLDVVLVPAFAENGAAVASTAAYGIALLAIRRSDRRMTAESKIVAA